MAAYKFNIFRGIRPRIAITKLGEGEAVTAQNINLGSGDIKPFKASTTIQAAQGSPKSIYKFDNLGSPLWFEWDEYVDVARGPVKDDLLERTYYTGDTAGNGSPKLTTNVLADLGNGGPYPESWWYIGVPAPATAPTVEVTALPEDRDPAARLASNFKSDTIEIDEVRWTVYPGTGTRNQTWRLDAAVTTAIFYTIQPGTSFRVTEIINNNKVKLESATEPGITAHTLTSDKSDTGSWKLMDEQGTTQTADFIGWRIPAGMEATIPGHALNVGDVIVVSAQNASMYSRIADDVDMHEQNWPSPLLQSEGTTDFYAVTDVALSPNATLGAAQWQISGSFYYDVDRASSDVSELEDRTYVYTYVNSLGEEGPPSPPSEVTAALDGQSILLQNLSLPPTIGYDIQLMRLYRTNSTEAGTEYQFVKEFDVARTVRDDVPSAELQEVISTTTWDPPHPQMRGLVALPNGMMAGFYGKQVYLCEPYFPHAWPAEYDQAVEYPIVGLSVFGNSLVVLTEGWPYIATGSHPRNMNLRPIKVNQACVSKESIATDGDRVYYATPVGLAEISVEGFRLVTDAYMSKDEWETYAPSTIVGEFHEGRYYGFYDFDVSAIPGVISAEVSGTITDAEESGIIDGGLTVILTLTNDVWVAEGATFNAQRAAIIAGLTASTSQTLGWNNEVRDGTLSVTDVVRTSDTVVTITLPATPDYAIIANETIQPTIPHAALVTRTTNLPTGSTFTIVPDEAIATITMGGTIDGATEAEIVTGGETITLTLTDDTWQSGDNFDNYRQELIFGLRSATNETNGWNDTVPHEIDVTDVVRTSDTVVTITLPAVSAYAITQNETIQATVPHEMLVTQQNVDGTSNTVGIVATGAASALFGGTIMSSTLESDIVAGGKIITITLTNDTWVAAGTGPIGTTAQSQALVDSIVAASSPTFGWNNVVVPGIDIPGDLVRTSDTVATITLDAESTYSIGADETITCTIPSGLLVTNTSGLAVINSFGITAQAPTTAALSGTVTASIYEYDIVAGGETIILTLSDDTWVAAGATFDAQRQNIIDGISAASSPTNGWNNIVRDTALTPGDVVRTSDTVVTITLPAAASYDISSAETITATIPASALTISSVAVAAVPTFGVAVDVPATAVASGTADGAVASDIRTGGKTIILDVSDDTWVAAGAAFDAQRQNIIDGLDAASTIAFGWNNEVRDGTLVPANVVRTSNTRVTITLPATSAYDIATAEVITCTIPASALTESTIAVVATNTIDVGTGTIFASRVFVNHEEGSGVDSELGISFLSLDNFRLENPAIEDGNDDLYALDLEYIVGIGAGAGRLCAVAQDGTSTTGEIWTSDDEGITWTSRTSAISLTGKLATKLKWVDTPDGDILFCVVDSDEVQYSTDGGATWTNITTACKAGTSFTEAIDFFYGGNYVYGLVVDGSDQKLIRSADLSTASTVASNWGAAFASDIAAGSGGFGAMGSGNGSILSTGKASGSSETSLEFVVHGDTESFKDDTNLPSSSGQPEPSFIVYGDTKWLMLDTNGKGWKIDLSTLGQHDEREAENWTRISSYIAESGSMTIKDVFYDSEIGFVVVGEVGTGIAKQVKVYTSADLITWTLRYTFAAESNWSAAATQKELSGTALGNDPAAPSNTITLSGTTGAPNMSTDDYTGIGAATAFWSFSHTAGDVWYKNDETTDQWQDGIEWHDGQDTPSGDYWMRVTSYSGTAPTLSNGSLGDWVKIRGVDAVSQSLTWQRAYPNTGTTTGVAFVEIASDSLGQNVLDSGYYGGTAVLT